MTITDNMENPIRGGHRRHRGPHHGEKRDVHGTGERGHREQGGHRGRRGGRLFDYGELRLLVLSILQEKPSHGYELIKTIEERFGGAYTPSPGVMYPTLSWAEDLGYAAVEAEGGRKQYRLTPDGEAFVTLNQSLVETLKARTVGEGRHGRHNAPEALVEAMGALKMALRTKMREGEVNDVQMTEMVNALKTAAETIHRI